MSSQPNYLAPVLEKVRQNSDRIRPGTVHEMRVSHDSWCLIFKGGVCSCNPAVELVEISRDRSNS